MRGEDMGRVGSQWVEEGGKKRWGVTGRRLVNGTFNASWRGSRAMNEVEMVEGRGWKSDKTGIQLYRA